MGGLELGEKDGFRTAVRTQPGKKTTEMRWLVVGGAGSSGGRRRHDIQPRALAAGVGRHLAAPLFILGRPRQFAG